MVVGVLFAGVGAACLALAMSVQRFALTTTPPVPVLCLELPQFTVWFMGLVIYWVANGLFAVALIFAPLALLGAIFTTLLVWNLFFGWYLLGEQVTMIKAIGAGVIMVGVSLIGIATPGGIPVEYSQAQAEAFIKDSTGAAYLTILILVVVVCIVIIAIFERTYPLPKEDTPQTSMIDRLLKLNGLSVYEGDQVVSMAAFAGASSGLANVSKNLESDGLAAISKKITIKQHLLSNADTPDWMNTVMGIIYPGSLGLDEGIGHLAMKCFMALLATCGDNGECGSGILWGMIFMWLVSSLGTLWWLRTVFRRYDVTQALPIEYGAVMACDALSAIVFYKEDAFMEGWQLGLTLVGVFVIIIGIIIGRMQPPSELETKPLYYRMMHPSCCQKQDDEVRKSETRASERKSSAIEDNADPEKRRSDTSESYKEA